MPTPPFWLASTRVFMGESSSATDKGGRGGGQPFPGAALDGDTFTTTLEMVARTVDHHAPALVELAGGAPGPSLAEEMPCG